MRRVRRSARTASRCGGGGRWTHTRRPGSATIRLWSATDLSPAGRCRVILLQAGTRFPGVIVFYVLLLVVFYMLLIRPQQTQQRKRRDMLGKLKKGDRIVTRGGLHATVHGIAAKNAKPKETPGAIAYTDHGARHANLTANIAYNTLKRLAYQERDAQLAAM